MDRHPAASFDKDESNEGEELDSRFFELSQHNCLTFPAVQFSCVEICKKSRKLISGV